MPDEHDWSEVLLLAARIDDLLVGVDKDLAVEAMQAVMTGIYYKPVIDLDAEPPF